MTSEFQLDRRSVIGATAAGAIAGLAGCAGLADTEPPGSKATNRWPDAQDGQREVMLLGTTHLAQAPGDTNNAYATDPGNILGDERQRELETLSDRLAEWEPDRVAVEAPASQQALLDDAYAAYTSETEELAAVSGWERNRRNEIVQIGFRLADALGHDSLAAVDYRQSPAALLTEEERKQLPNSLRELIVDPSSVEYPLPDPVDYIEDQQRRLDENSLVEFYKYLNDPEVGGPAWHNDRQFYAMAFENSEPGDYTYTKIMTAWTQRNLRIASNIWNVPDADDERVLVVYGASHVPQLGQILTGTPMMAPVSPLPYLEG